MAAHTAMINLWKAWEELSPPTTSSPEVRTLFASVFTAVKTHDIIDHWEHVLSDPVEVSHYCKVVAEGLQPGALDIFTKAANGDGRYPSFGGMKGSLLSAFFFPIWLVYFLLAEPYLDPSLPKLGYVGSATGSAGHFTGGESRARSHFLNFRNGR